MTVSEEPERLPRVDVLMATYNGRRWIEPQIDSILDQNGVDVRLIVSDDGSEDGTADYLRARAAKEPRIVLLPARQGRRGVTPNFLHLFAQHSVTADVYVAFSDQDDLWHPDKLHEQIRLVEASGADAVSSNVTSFSQDGHRRLVVKSDPQRRWDYLFEAAGPGSTYVFTPSLHARLVGALVKLDISVIDSHDWFLYALTRALGDTWVIDPRPLVDYRQHASNALGEHRGVRAFERRLAALRSGFYRRQFLATARACREVAASVRDPGWLEDLDALIADLAHSDLASRWRIAARFRDIRRDRLEGLELATSCLLGVW